jgi:ABC-type lipoprotein export system ATPase subunit
VDITGMDERRLAALRNRKIGIVFQSFNLIPSLTAQENVEVPLYVRPGMRDAPARARALLDLVGLGPRRGHRPHQLSGGEQQRVAIARALVTDPTLLLADEPTGNLDRKNAQAVGELLLDLHRQENNILVVVTHSADLAKLFPARSEVDDGILITV